MKTKLIFTLLVATLLAGCGATPTTSEDTSISATTTSDVVSEDSLPVTSDAVTSEEDLPPLPGTSTGPIQTGNITFAGEIPAGWTYITNDAKFPTPAFYADGGFKFNFPNQALKSPVYEGAVNSVTLTGKLNANEKKEGPNTTLTLIKIVDGVETEVDSVVFPPSSPATFTKSFTIAGGATQFMIKLAGNVGFNVNLNTIAIS